MGNLNSLKIRIEILFLKINLSILKFKQRRAIAPLIIAGGIILALKVGSAILDERKASRKKK